MYMLAPLNAETGGGLCIRDEGRAYHVYEFE